VAAMALPLAHPDAPLWVWRTLFYGGLAIATISSFFLIYALFIRQRPPVQQQNKDFMSFKTVFSMFKEELERESPEDYHSLGSIMERQNQSQENYFVIRFGQSINVEIYGKIPSESFKEWVKIDKDLFFNCKIKNGLELYRNNVLEYTDLAIKISDLERSIKESKLSLTDEFISRLYRDSIC
jgi:hypothetical protein